MENTNWDSAQDAAPHNDWRNDETNTWLTDPSSIQDNEFRSADAPRYGTVDTSRLNAVTSNDDPDEDEVEDTEDEEDAAGDWGHVDPAESNGPFPDPNAPTAPGSAV